MNIHLSKPNWGVCCVAILRESYPWWRDWIEHHLLAGASKIVIYDNTGSVGSLDPYSDFQNGKLQESGISKRGERYGELTSHLRDEQIRDELESLAACYEGHVEILDWAPKHPDTGVIVHGQVESYVDFIRRYRGLLDWGLFIDPDEYIYCAPEFSVFSLLVDCERNQPDVSLIQINQIPFEMRWGEGGPKRMDDLLARRLPVPHGSGMKMFARLRDVTHAAIHYEWRVKSGRSRVLAYEEQLAFRHHSVSPETAGWIETAHDPRAFLENESTCIMPTVRWSRMDESPLSIVSLPID